MTNEQVEAAALALVKVTGWGRVNAPMDVTGTLLAELAKDMARAAIEAYEATKSGTKSGTSVTEGAK